MCKNHKHSYTPIADREPNHEQIPFIIATKRIKYIGIQLTREVKYLYNGNYKTLPKEIRNDKQVKTHSMLMDRKNQYNSNGCTAQRDLQIQYHFYPKLPMTFFTEMEKLF